jgi:hypothetical protein
MHARVRSSAPRVQSSALGRPGNVKTLELAYKYNIFHCKRTGGSRRVQNFDLESFLSFSNAFLCKFLFLYDFNGFVYVFCYHERLKPSTKVEDEALSLIHIYIFVVYATSQYLIN